MLSRNNLCNNCGKQGHLFNQCLLPIISFGVIVFKNNKSTNKREYLMIRRKDSFGFIDFVRSKYSLNHLHHLRKSIDEMSNDEKYIVQMASFDNLNKCLHGDFVEKQRLLSTLLDMGFREDHASREEEEREFYAEKAMDFQDIPKEITLSILKSTADENNERAKFESIKKGILVKDTLITLESLVQESNTQWEETEWEFPKGRKMINETELMCALREFEEETGIASSQIEIIDNLVPIEEIFLGSNNKPYKHKYFVGFVSENNEFDMTQFQKSEVSKLEWKTLTQCRQSIRNYHKMKTFVIETIDHFLQNNIIL